jgi:hypothetical protein
MFRTAQYFFAGQRSRFVRDFRPSNWRPVRSAGAFPRDSAAVAAVDVYTAAYGSPTALQTASCSTDTISPAVSACSTMQMMASSAKTFFPINQNGSGTCSSSVNSNSDAANALTNIGAAINGGGSQPRLVLNSTQ